MIYMDISKEEEIKDFIREWFMSQFGIELEDSPQILDNYLYLEFESGNSGTKKYRLYFTNRTDFLNLNHSDMKLWILEFIFQMTMGV